jgi:hypothetical protein
LQIAANWSPESNTGLTFGFFILFTPELCIRFVGGFQIAAFVVEVVTHPQLLGLLAAKEFTPDALRVSAANFGS